MWSYPLPMWQSGIERFPYCWWNCDFCQKWSFCFSILHRFTLYSGSQHWLRRSHCPLSQFFTALISKSLCSTHTFFMPWLQNWFLLPIHSSYYCSKDLFIPWDFNCHHPLWDFFTLTDKRRSEIFDYIISSDLLLITTRTALPSYIDPPTTDPLPTSL